jgi:TolA-binding protein
MARSIRFVFAGAAITLACLSFAQQQRPEGPTLDERLTALEAGLARLDTRLGLATTRPPDSAGQSELAARITELERTVERLATDLQRVDRLADNAARGAYEAQRTATSAEQAARDAALRAR